MTQIDLKEDIFHFAMEKPLDELIRKMSAFNDHNTDLEDAYNGDVIRCYAHVSNEKFGLRVNTVQMYYLANAKVNNDVLFILLIFITIMIIYSLSNDCSPIRASSFLKNSQQ